eukprot:Skav208244  [mRNA]  locus=scaffold2093:125392:129902:- [translate_table: standard]
MATGQSCGSSLQPTRRSSRRIAMVWGLDGWVPSVVASVGTYWHKRVAEKRVSDDPLLCAAGGGHLDIVQQLVAARARLDVVRNDGPGPRTVAQSKGHDEVAEFLAAWPQRSTAIGESDVEASAARGFADLRGTRLSRRDHEPSVVWLSASVVCRGLRLHGGCHATTLLHLRARELNGSPDPVVTRGDDQRGRFDQHGSPRQLSWGLHITSHVELVSDDSQLGKENEKPGTVKTEENTVNPGKEALMRKRWTLINKTLLNLSTYDLSHVLIDEVPKPVIDESKRQWERRMGQWRERVRGALAELRVPESECEWI